MAMSVRYIVNSTDDLEVYRLLGFEVIMHPAPGFAMLGRGDDRLMLSVPGGGGGGGAAVDGQQPAPGGWNRIIIEVDSIADTVSRLRSSGVRIRADSVEGVAGSQAIVEDASGNPIELREPSGR